MTLEIIVADTLGPVRHGFFTRRGGASSGIFSGLNCGPGSSDQADAVAINRARVAAAMGMPAEALVTLDQVHSARVLTLSALPADGGGERRRPRADAMVTSTPGLLLGILTADCAPILLADPEAGVIGAAHAGWRGAMAGICHEVVAAMEALGASRRNIRAAIGPCIGQAAYEVGPEFFDRFLAEDPGNARHFAGGEGDRLHFNLPGYVLARLRAAGLTEVEWTGHCTCSDPERFFSYRRATLAGKRDYGRQISVITL